MEWDVLQLQHTSFIFFFCICGRKTVTNTRSWRNPVTKINMAVQIIQQKKGMLERKIIEKLRYLYEAKWSLEIILEDMHIVWMRGKAGYRKIIASNNIYCWT